MATHYTPKRELYNHDDGAFVAKGGDWDGEQCPGERWAHFPAKKDNYFVMPSEMVLPRYFSYIGLAGTNHVELIAELQDLAPQLTGVTLNLVMQTIRFLTDMVAQGKLKEA